MNPKVKRLRVSMNFTKAAAGEILSLGDAVVKGMAGNDAFPNPPVDPAALKRSLSRYSIAVADALDGGKRALAQRHQEHDGVVKSLRLLANYVESACNDNVTTLLSSGFQPLVTTRVPPQPLPPPSIRKIDHGSTGQLLVSINSMSKAFSFELRYASLAAGGIQGDWNNAATATVVSPTAINGLTPGTVYVFQARALGRLGFSDWSPSVTKMCT